jgi:hypothetical protein
MNNFKEFRTIYIMIDVNFVFETREKNIIEFLKNDLELHNAYKEGWEFIQVLTLQTASNTNSYFALLGRRVLGELLYE